MNLFRTKPVTQDMFQSPLHRCLSAFDLTLFGIGAIIGAGVFVLTGIAAALKAGPAVSLSYVLAGLASLFTALAYAELASSVGGAGSAYSYSYASFGEIIAWIIGWDLLLEYTVSVSSVAIGWSGYVNNALQAINIHLPKIFVAPPAEGGWVNLPAMGIVILLAIVLCIGVKQSARFNAIIVLVKLLAIAIFIGVAIPHVHEPNWHPFFPFGWDGVAQGAALVFFAYIGFDAVSTAAEETIDPQRSLPIGILGSLIICTLIYVIVAALLTGIVSYTQLNVPSPVADALLQIGHPIASGIIALGAIAGLTTVMLAMYYGLTRITLAMSRDGLLPPLIASIHPQTKTPIRIILLSGIIIAAIAGFMPLTETAALVNIGTLTAFTLVCGGVIFMRKFHPDLPRSFKVPFSPWIPLLGILFCFYLMINLAASAWIRLGIWLMIGIVIYFIYSKKHSLLQKT